MHVLEKETGVGREGGTEGGMARPERARVCVLGVSVTQPIAHSPFGHPYCYCADDFTLGTLAGTECLISQIIVSDGLCVTRTHTKKRFLCTTWGQAGISRSMAPWADFAVGCFHR